ncbi:prenyltransferase/squalene oxidase repeat-containing protein [Salipaludibacillus neizhouensis]|uniref:hypothetical protein n=1 Tax=Salipaludibacillus neizhouensis TaxID=885475 RepID=UPI001CBA608E|nr:hypothetical protein [Salipaludibacillus neizhouensis]
MSEKALLDELENQFEGFYSWLWNQYDKESGGFYYAKSSRHTGGFPPDIESTSQAINIMVRNEFFSKLPQEMIKSITRFYQAKQDPESGYFYDENPLMKQDEVMVHRALSYATGALRRLGSQPLYPLPVEAKAAPAYTKSPESYLEKWKSIDLSNSWRGCDLIATSCVYISLMEKNSRQKFLREAEAYLASIQNQKTGFWGEGSLYEQLSGTFKLHTFYSRHQIEMPNKELIYQTVLETLRHEEAFDMCYSRNPLDLLHYIRLPISKEERLEIVEITVNNIRQFKRDDGGFSRERHASPPAPNVAQVKPGHDYPNMPPAVNLGRGLVEGDMNASTQATLIRMRCRELLGEDPTVPVKGAAQFFGEGTI